MCESLGRLVRSKTGEEGPLPTSLWFPAEFLELPSEVVWRKYVCVCVCACVHMPQPGIKECSIDKATASSYPHIMNLTKKIND